MSNNRPEEFDPMKRHWELESKNDQDVVCTLCGKVLEHRDELPDYIGFMGAVLIKQNLPCVPLNDDIGED